MCDVVSVPQCLSAEQILFHFGFSNVSQLTVGHLERICPAVLTQVLLPSCPFTTPNPTPTLDYTGELLHHVKRWFICEAPNNSNKSRFMVVKGL